MSKLPPTLERFRMSVLEACTKARELFDIKSTADEGARKRHLLYLKVLSSEDDVHRELQRQAPPDVRKERDRLFAMMRETIAECEKRWPS